MKRASCGAPTTSASSATSSPRVGPAARRRRAQRQHVATGRARSRASRALRLLPRQLARPLVRHERVGQLGEVARQHLVELVEGEVDAVVGDPVLLVVVGADLVGAAAGADLAAALGRHLGGLAVLLGLQQACPQHHHRLGPVLDLRLLVLHGHDRAGRDVRDPHGRVRRVDRLPAGAGRAVDVDLEVVGVDLDLDLLRLGQHGHRRGGGVDPALGLGGRHALDAVRAALVLQADVGVGALDDEDGLVDPVLVGLVLGQHLDLPLVHRGVAQVHVVEVAREEVGLVAADGAADLHDHVAALVGVLRQQQGLHALLERHRPGPRTRRAPGA